MTVCLLGSTPVVQVSLAAPANQLLTSIHVSPGPRRGKRPNTTQAAQITLNPQPDLTRGVTQHRINHTAHTHELQEYNDPEIALCQSTLHIQSPASVKQFDKLEVFCV